MVSKKIKWFQWEFCLDYTNMINKPLQITENYQSKTIALFMSIFRNENIFSETQVEITTEMR